MVQVNSIKTIPPNVPPVRKGQRMFAVQQNDVRSIIRSNLNSIRKTDTIKLSK